MVKKRIRKKKNCDRRDLWDGPNVYWFWGLSVDKLKHKLQHIPKKDRRMKKALKEILEWKTRRKK